MQPQLDGSQQTGGGRWWKGLLSNGLLEMFIKKNRRKKSCVFFFHCFFPFFFCFCIFAVYSARSQALSNQAVTTPLKPLPPTSHTPKTVFFKIPSEVALDLYDWRCGSWDLPSEHTQASNPEENRRISCKILQVILSCKRRSSVSVILSYRHHLWIMNWKEPLITSESESATPGQLCRALFCFPFPAVLRSEAPVNLLNLLSSSRANGIWPWTLHMLSLLTNHPVKDSPSGKNLSLISQ